MRTYTIKKRCDRCGIETIISPEQKTDHNKIKEVWCGAAYVVNGKPTLKKLDLCDSCRASFFREFSELLRHNGWSEFNDREEEYEEGQEVDDDW